MQRVLLGLLLVLVFTLTGCGKKHSQADVEKGKTAVTEALDNWKSNEAPDKLKSATTPVDFQEELRSQFTLIEFSVIKTDSTDPQVLRYTVKLSLKDKKGKLTEREVTYAVQIQTPILVSRDPYF